jgi:hypothetical protein
MAGKNFWGDVVSGAELGCEYCFFGEEGGGPEVNEFDR